ncbi:MAG: hypothetical protein KC656_12645, partial [Myxococcales bacterium]|nr:hypothetical protein [Myxococcales bacterium]
HRKLLETLADEPASLHGIVRVPLGNLDFDDVGDVDPDASFERESNELEQLGVRGLPVGEEVDDARCVEGDLHL